MNCGSVSLVIPTYNGSKYLRQTIESALTQTYQDIEVIVIDDGSDEDIAELLRPYGESVRLCRTERRGPAAARNLGVRLSTGQYIGFLDHDDLWAPEKTEVQVRVMNEEKDCGLVYSHPQLIDGSGQTLTADLPEHLPSGRVFLDFLSQNRIITFSATLIRTAIFREVGGLDESPVCLTCDDYDLWLRIAYRYEVRFVPGSWLYYRVHEGNLLGNYEQNLRAHDYVLNKWATDNSVVSGIGAPSRMRAIDRNRHRQYCYFATLFYYRRRDYAMARRLWRKALQLEPFDAKTAAYFMLCCLPAPGVEAIRTLKRRLT